MPSDDADPTPDRPPTLINVHGHVVRLGIDHPIVARAAASALAPLADEEAPVAPACRGEILDYEVADVTRGIPADARAVRPGEPAYHPLLELYRSPAGDRWWLVDERWGLAEIDLVKQAWRAFVLRAPSIDAARLLDGCVRWPMAQILKAFSLHLLPATSLAIEHAGVRRGALLLGRHDPTRELRAWRVRGGHLLGRGWAALRFSPHDGATLLPTATAPDVARVGRPLRLDAGPGETVARVPDVRRAGRTPLGLILIAEGPRRPRASVAPLAPAEAKVALRSAWPMPQLANNASPLASQLASVAAVHRLRLDRSGEGLADLLLGAPRARAA